jgi:hypothetical protein
MHKFIMGKRDEFMNKDGKESVFAMGEALHPLMDRHSPEHRGFQTWGGFAPATKPGELLIDLAGAALHASHENSDNISEEQLDKIAEGLRNFYLLAAAEKQRRKEMEERKKEDEEREEGHWKKYDPSQGSSHR